MNYFEQELRRVANHCKGASNTVFAGRACYVDIGGDNRAKLQFVTTGIANRYDAFRVTILNRIDGEVDCLLFRFRDVWGKKQVTNTNFGDGIIPYIWTYNGTSEWYVYHTTDADMKKLASEVSEYLAVFADRSIAPEKSKQAEKTSVIKSLRDSRQKPAAMENKPKRPAHKKSGQEL